MSMVVLLKSSGEEIISCWVNPEQTEIALITKDMKVLYTPDITKADLIYMCDYKDKMYSKLFTPKALNKKGMNTKVNWGNLIEAFAKIVEVKNPLRG